MDSRFEQELIAERDRLRLALQEAQDQASTYALRLTEAHNERIKAQTAIQELAEALRELVEDYDELGCTPGNNEHPYYKAKAALAKAAPLLR